MTSKQIELEDVGTICFVKSNRAKNLNITVKPFKHVRVTVPRRVSFSEAENVVTQKVNWIRKHQERMRIAEKKRTVFDENNAYHTRDHIITIGKTENDKITIKVFDGKIDILYPQQLKVEDKNVQMMIRKGIEKAFRIEAKEYLPGRVRELAKQHGFNFNKIFVKNIKSRWGSCSKKRNVNFSIHLMRLPNELIDYVILHELAHTIQHNHSKKYWAVLDKIYGNAKAVDKKLKNYRISF
jgi:predicted metal-dependent hydrolase